MINKIRGTLDILPEETPRFRQIEEKARKTAALYGFKEIRTPTFEATELYKRGVGDTTDVVQKEMYTFSDLDGRSLTLRPEGTAGVARAVIEHGRCSDAMPLKLYYLMNCFRYEAPQAGRSREFFQFGVEMFGAPDPSSDALIINLAYDFLCGLGITGLELRLNSIGCPECRAQYRKALVGYFDKYKGKLCETCAGRLNTNPMRILDCKSPVCKEISKNAPVITDYLCPDCKEHFEKLQVYLKDAGIPFILDTAIVRGLDYYTRTVFEFVCAGIGAQSTVCGGGRYDGLMEQLGGPKLPGIGFAAGITRLVLAMEQSGVPLPDEDDTTLYIAPLGDEARRMALTLTQNLRRGGIKAECDIVGRSLKAQMKYADKIKAGYTLIIGESEINSGEAPLRDMQTSNQTTVRLDGLADAIKQII